MAEKKAFRSSEAQEVFAPGTEGDFILPICMPETNLLVGEDLAILQFETIEGQRVGVPLGIDALSDLHALLGEALRLMSAPEGGTLQ